MSDFISGWRRLFRLPPTDRSLAREIDDEIRFHIESRVEDLVREGISESRARAVAEAEYGDSAKSRRELFDVDRKRLGQERRQEILMSVADDLRYAARGIARRPAFSAIIVFTFAVGIGANAVMFDVVDRLLIQPPPFVRDPATIENVYFHQHSKYGDFTGSGTSYPAASDLANAPGVESMTMFFRVPSMTLGRGADARNADALLVSGNYFTSLGVHAARGRAITPADDQPPDGSSVVVISDGLWKQAFGASSDVLGKSIELSAKRFTIVGVAPEGFNGLETQNVDVWVPMSAMAGDVIARDWREGNGHFWVESFARMRPGVPAVQLAAQMTSIVRTSRNVRSHDTVDVQLSGVIGARTPKGLSIEGRVSVWLLGVSAMVFLIACANVANLLIADVLRRRREIAVRLALGVGRSRLLQQFLVEAGLLAALGAAVALLVAHWAAGLVRAVLLPGIVSRAAFDWRLAGFVVLATLGCVIFAGLVPAIRGINMSVAEGLKSSSRQVAGERGILRGGLLAVQAMLSVILLVGAGLFVRSLHNVSGRDVGLAMDSVHLVRMNLRSMGFAAPDIQQLYQNAVTRVRQTPGVASASVVGETVPMQMGSGMGMLIPGTKKPPEIPGGGPYYSIVGSDFFATTGTKILRGRALTPDDDRGPSRALVITELVAKSYWPGEDPIGKCVTLGDDYECTRVVGVTQNMLFFSLVRDDRAVIYVPTGHPVWGKLTGRIAMMFRTNGDPAVVLPEVRKQIQRLSPNMPFVTLESYSEIVAPQVRPWRLGATMFTLFGVIALVIAAVGLYSVLAHWVSQRTQEIGVRMALGADARDVVRLVATKGSLPIALGIATGFLVAAIASRKLGDLLYETSPHDARVYLISLGVLVLAAIAATVVPALRSTSVDPVTALRAD